PLAAATAGITAWFALRAVVVVLAASLPLQNRFCLRVRIRREAGDHFLRNLALDQFLDVAQECVLVDAYQRDRFAACARAAGAANALHVIVGDVWQVVVDHRSEEHTSALQSL